MAKSGFVFIVALFGALMFLAGLLAPSTWRESASNLVKRVSTARTAAAPADAAPASATKEEPPVAYRTLLLSTSAPADTKYALQLGALPDQTQAQTLADRLRTLRIPHRVISVTGEQGEPLVLVTGGEYATPAEARDARGEMQRQVPQATSFIPIQLPAAAKAPN